MLRNRDAQDGRVKERTERHLNRRTEHLFHSQRPGDPTGAPGCPHPSDPVIGNGDVKRDRYAPEQRGRRSAWSWRAVVSPPRPRSRRPVTCPLPRSRARPRPRKHRNPHRRPATVRKRRRNQIHQASRAVLSTTTAPCSTPLTPPRMTSRDISKALETECGANRCGVAVVVQKGGECAVSIGPDPVPPGETVTIVTGDCRPDGEPSEPEDVPPPSEEDVPPSDG
jgi:hypothetical protein